MESDGTARATWFRNLIGQLPVTSDESALLLLFGSRAGIVKRAISARERYVLNLISGVFTEQAVETASRVSEVHPTHHAKSEV